MSRPLRTSFIARLLPPAAVFAMAVVALEALVRWRNVPQYLLPRPSAVLATLWTDRGALLPALATTAAAALAGFLASLVLGIAGGAVLAASPIVRRGLYPYAIFFQTVPLVAVAPLLVFWIDPGMPLVATCAFIASVFPVIANTLTGLRSTDPALVDLFRLYDAGPIASLLKLRLPSALPAILAGLRVSAGLAVIGTVVSEVLVGLIGEDAGLGVKVTEGIKYGRTDRVFAAVLLVSLLGLCLFAAVNGVSWLLLRRWHASEGQ